MNDCCKVPLFPDIKNAEDALTYLKALTENLGPAEWALFGFAALGALLALYLFARFSFWFLFGGKKKVKADTPKVAPLPVAYQSIGDTCDRPCKEQCDTECKLQCKEQYKEVVKETLSLNYRLLETLDRALDTIDRVQSEALSAVKEVQVEGLQAIKDSQSQAAATLENIVESFNSCDGTGGCCDDDDEDDDEE